MTSLPKGWKRISIGSLCELINGRAFKPSDWGQSGLPIVRIQNLNDPDAKFNYFGGENVRSRFLIDTGALLFAWSGTPGTSFGAHIWNGGPAILNQHIFNVVFDETKVDKDFFRWAINQKLDELIDKAHGGVGLRHVTKGKFEETEIVLPPICDQRCIVERVNSLLNGSKNARNHLNRVPKLVERYKQAILMVALRGDLTREVGVSSATGKPVGTSTDMWERTSLLEICDQARGVTYGVIKLGEETPGGVPCLRTSNVRWLRIETDNMKRISSELSSDYSRTILRGGEVLVNVRGTLGGVAVAEPHMAGWNVSREVAVLPIDTSRVEPAYVAFWIGSDASQAWLRKVEKGVAYTGVNLEDLRKLPVSVPPIGEQREIVRSIVEAFSRIDALSSEAEHGNELIGRLEQAVLTKAFRGGLVAQDLAQEGLPESVDTIHDEGQQPGRRKRMSV